jgi:hypothetical protein
VSLSQPPRDKDGKVIPHNHAGIGSLDGIIRRITEQYIVTEANGRRRLSSMAFSPSSDLDGGMSVDLQVQIEKAGLDCREYLNTTAAQCIGAIRFEAGALREKNFQVGFDPMPLNPYHGEVWGQFTSRMKRQILPHLASWFIEIAGISIVSSQS